MIHVKTMYLSFVDAQQVNSEGKPPKTSFIMMMTLWNTAYCICRSLLRTCCKVAMKSLLKYFLARKIAVILISTQRLETWWLHNCRPCSRNKQNAQWWTL